MQDFIRIGRLFLLAAVTVTGGSVWAAFDPATAYREANEVAGRASVPKLVKASTVFVDGRDGLHSGRALARTGVARP